MKEKLVGNSIHPSDAQISVDFDNLLEIGFNGYETYHKLPKELQFQIDLDQDRYGCRKVSKATAKSISKALKSL